MTCGLIVFSRMGSKRLPGKALRDIQGRPMLGRVLDQAAGVQNVSRIVVATSDDPGDNPIVAFACSENHAYFRGSEADVADRALACAIQYGFSKFVRISGDSPFFDPTLVDTAVAISNETGVDLVTNTFPRSFPPGMSVEVITTDAMRKVLERTSASADREHVTKFMYDEPAHFSIHNFSSGQPSLAETRLVVDTEVDLKRANWIAAKSSSGDSRPSVFELANLAAAWDQALRIGIKPTMRPK